MRFFTTITPAGKAEYFVIALLLNLGIFYVAFRLFMLDFTLSPMSIGYAVDQIPTMAFAFAAYAALIVITSLRRMKELKMGSWIAFLTPIPVLGQLVQLRLSASDDQTSATFTPYGDNPYDPNSWVAPTTSAGKDSPAVSFRGEALMLPGEATWDDERGADAA